jgi:hypothetical protein
MSKAEKLKLLEAKAGCRIEDMVDPRGLHHRMQPHVRSQLGLISVNPDVMMARLALLLPAAGVMEILELAEKWRVASAPEA